MMIHGIELGYDVPFCNVFVTWVQKYVPSLLWYAGPNLSRDLSSISQQISQSSTGRDSMHCCKLLWEVIITIIEEVIINIIININIFLQKNGFLCTLARSMRRRSSPSLHGPSALGWISLHIRVPENRASTFFCIPLDQSNRKRLKEWPPQPKKTKTSILLKK